MSTYANHTRSFPVSTAMSMGALVEIFTDGKIRVNSYNRVPLGVLLEDCTANSYENPAVRLWGSGSARVQVASAMTVGDTCYAVTAGQIASTNGSTTTRGYGIVVGTMLETTTTAQTNNLFEIAMQFGQGPADSHL